MKINKFTNTIRNSLLFLILNLTVFNYTKAEDVILVSDINKNPRALEVYGRCAIGNLELLIADDGLRGAELWQGDGLAGTRLVKDIYPGIESGFPSTSCITFGNSIIFSANDGVNGAELWISDGSTTGTSLLKDINPGSNNSFPGRFTVLGNKVIFIASDGSNGNELWITDGTSTGTVLLKDIFTGAGSANPSSFVVLNNSIAIFSAFSSGIGNELWKTDGTGAGTVLIKDIRTGASSSSPDSLTLLGNKVFFSASTAAVGKEPWITDGTDTGTTLLADLNTNASDGFYGFGEDLAVVNGKVLFTGRNASSGFELFVSDGTPSGTGLLKDIDVGAANSFPSRFQSLGGKVVFSALTSATGRELYVSDGTPSGTTLVTDLNVGSDDGIELGVAKKLVDNSKLIFNGGVVKSSAQQIYSWNGDKSEYPPRSGWFAEYCSLKGSVKIFLAHQQLLADECIFLPHRAHSLP